MRTAAIAAGALVAVALILPATPVAAPSCLGESATVTGTPGDDELSGTDGDDVIFAGD